MSTEIKIKEVKKLIKKNKYYLFSGVIITILFSSLFIYAIYSDIKNITIQRDIHVVHEICKNFGESLLLRLQKNVELQTTTFISSVINRLRGINSQQNSSVVAIPDHTKMLALEEKKIEYQHKLFHRFLLYTLNNSSSNASFISRILFEDLKKELSFKKYTDLELDVLRKKSEKTEIESIEDYLYTLCKEYEQATLLQINIEPGELQEDYLDHLMYKDDIKLKRKNYLLTHYDEEISVLLDKLIDQYKSRYPDSRLKIIEFSETLQDIILSIFNIHDLLSYIEDMNNSTIEYLKDHTSNLEKSKIFSYYGNDLATIDTYGINSIYNEDIDESTRENNQKDNEKILKAKLIANDADITKENKHIEQMLKLLQINSLIRYYSVENPSGLNLYILNKKIFQFFS